MLQALQALLMLANVCYQINSCERPRYIRKVPIWFIKPEN